MKSCVALAFALLMSRDAFAERTLAYFDPDGNQQAIVSITTAFNDYLTKRKLPLTFQPVQQLTKLNELIASGTVDYAIVSSRMIPELKARKKVLLIQEAGGDIYYRKMLVDRAADPNAKFSGRTIAVSLSDAAAGGTQRLLGELSQQGINTTGVFVIPVVKDVDALLALAFGQVQGALVTQASMEVVKRINPQAVQQMRVVRESARILRSQLCQIGEPLAERDERMVRAMVQMAGDPDGARSLKAMGFDRWIEAKAGGEL